MRAVSGNGSEAGSPLAELDATLRALLQRGIAASGLGAVELTFEAPTREASAKWPSPALNLFLYDVREAEAPRDRSFHRGGGEPVRMRRAPMRLECRYAVTAWAGSPLDEHRLLSRVLTLALATPQLTGEQMAPGLRVGDPPHPLEVVVARGREHGVGELWSALGTPYRLALELAVTILVRSDVELVRGPAVGTVGVHPTAMEPPVRDRAAP